MRVLWTVSDRHRDAHGDTWHQPDGKDMPNIHPPLTNTEWLADIERLIKIVLTGLWGPLKVGDKTFEAAQGVPSMTSFAALLNAHVAPRTVFSR